MSNIDMKEIKESAKDIIIAVIITLLILQFIKPTFVRETSMMPTLQEYNFVSQQAGLSFWRTEARRHHRISYQSENPGPERRKC